MTIIRTSHNRENPYVMLNKSVVQNKQLSLKAKGLWALLMSYPNDWKFYVKKLIEECKEGRTAVYNTIDELIAARLMIRIQTFERREDGKMCGGGVEYIIFEFPITDEEAERYEKESKNVIKRPDNEHDRDSGFWNSENRDSENQQLLNTDLKPSIDKQQTTTEPSAVAAAHINIFPCLKTVAIPDKEKEWLCQNYSEQQIKSAIAWSRLPTTKINKTLAAALKWACENKMGISQDSVEITMEHEHRKHAQNLERTIHSDHYRFLALDNHCEVLGSDLEKAIEFDYKDPQFYVNLASFLSKKRFVKM